MLNKCNQYYVKLKKGGLLCDPIEQEEQEVLLDVHFQDVIEGGNMEFDKFFIVGNDCLATFDYDDVETENASSSMFDFDNDEP